MRILGRISIAVQFVLLISGYFQIKGLVVTNLYHLFHPNSVAGTNMQKQLTNLSGELEYADKGAMTPKSFANFVRLAENFTFKNKLV